MAKHDDEPKRSKPTAEQIHNALHSALTALVADAEQSGRRDQPAVSEAKAALAMAEPEETKVEERARLKAERD